MVEILKKAGIDYRHGPEKGVGFQYFSEVSPASKAMMVKNEQCMTILTILKRNPC